MILKVNPHKKFPGIYQVILENGETKLATLNLSPEISTYGEKLVQYKGKEYRIWNPYRSKIAAAILKGLKQVPIKPKHKVLYLGAASGTTASHISDIVGIEGYVYCVEFAPRSMRELISKVCIFRKNVSPILADARFPERYRMFVEAIDHIYCDIAQPEQASILADNANIFLKTEGHIIQAIKARSIDAIKSPSEIYEKEIKTLKERSFDIEEIVYLNPYDKDHSMVVAKSRKH